ncbi:3-dehydroquinate synthase [Pseudomarimonas salicorniae]|uniref:3-dehydroquinate synthase n=1 Tax=Pseudomarimonas salicorniae TaxID=2933270 RepID=A0ABT0GKD9_9GAMM|nr:3-dehydroquinate synthase [Lysobacter sp. CAU 1642]MCK7595012.1 3-dehydroquinate synthase [Lysobacter sp. CAU 1642]
MTRTVHVELGSRRYPIHIGSGLLEDPQLIASTLGGRHVMVLSDANVAPHYADRVLAALGERVHALHVLPPGEAEKTLARFAEVMEAMARLRASRDATLVALGGGVIGDLGGFAAACWMRGIRFVQLPTTLLAMVDSSVGGKTAVDLPAGKNLVGAFHQPSAVLIDTDTLATLPDRELRAGLAEVVKYGAIFDADFLAWLEQYADALLAREPAALAEAIARSCRHKAEVVARDETEQGERALLNFGHTFGHALETEVGYHDLLHGEAVAIGMVCAARLSARLGRAPEADAARLAVLLDRMGLPIAPPPGLDPERLLAHMRLDKKNLSGALRLILWRGTGQAELVSGVDEAEVLAVWREALSG